MKYRSLGALFVLSTIWGGCSNHQPSDLSAGSTGSPDHLNSPLVRSSQVTVLDSNHPSVAPGVSSSQSVNVVVTVDRDALLSQEFLYGADLQYSSDLDSGMKLYNQSMAIGHVPVKFRIAGNELQLIADNKRLYPSDVNHPEKLMSRYKILSQTEAVLASDKEPARPATLTLSGANSGIALSNLFSGNVDEGHGTSIPQDLWIRSFEYVSSGNYLLQQTSITLSDGTIAEFMESVFPRSTLTPGKDFEKFEMNPDSPSGADSGPVARFRMLPGEKIFEGEKSVAYAQHFDLSADSSGASPTIDFYVTPNIPDADLEPVRLAVEGWNRYFSKMKGIERNVVQFKGKLPEGIHLGDPRYNVINWDSRRVAGAAYESQATDPSTGKQSHSLIYMPAAWLQIGEDYWKAGQFSDLDSGSVGQVALSKRNDIARPARVACMRDVSDVGAIPASGRLSGDEVQIFAVQTLKQTLFHEVGHSLGLAHNFKGSLSFDRTKPESLFSTSIMDYNDYEIERAAFKAVDSSDGPLLEYDRQAISAIYNHGQNIAASDSIVPVCNDDEADTEVAGVDPLCIRYDIENDPTLSNVTAYERLTLETRKDDITLAQALTRVGRLVVSDSALEGVKNKEDMDTLLKKLSDSIGNSFQFYTILGKESLSKTAVINIKSLLQFEDKILPDTYNEGAMRERAFQGLVESAKMKQLPEVVSDELLDIQNAVESSLEKSPYVQSLKDQARLDWRKGLDSVFAKAVSTAEKDEDHGLPKMRSTVFAALKRHAKVPFFLGKMDGNQVDFETAIASLLKDATVDSDRAKGERVSAAGSLVSFKGRLAWVDKALKVVEKKLNEERALARDNDSRETVEAILTALKG